MTWPRSSAVDRAGDPGPGAARTPGRLGRIIACPTCACIQVAERRRPPAYGGFPQPTRLRASHPLGMGKVGSVRRSMEDRRADEDLVAASGRLRRPDGSPITQGLPHALARDDLHGRPPEDVSREVARHPPELFLQIRPRSPPLPDFQPEFEPLPGPIDLGELRIVVEEALRHQVRADADGLIFRDPVAAEDLRGVEAEPLAVSRPVRHDDERPEPGVAEMDLHRGLGEDLAGEGRGDHAAPGDDLLVAFDSFRARHPELVDPGLAPQLRPVLSRAEEGPPLQVVPQLPGLVRSHGRPVTDRAASAGGGFLSARRANPRPNTVSPRPTRRRRR